jgi:polysaccharide biosynthesis/export protein
MAMDKSTRHGSIALDACGIRMLVLWTAAWAIMGLPAQSQEPSAALDRKYVPLSLDDMMHQNASGEPRQSPTQKINDRLTSLKEAAHQARDYTLGPGDVVEVNVIGVTALEGKVFALDSHGNVSLPYIGEVTLRDMTTKQAESRIKFLFEVSLVVNPEVSVRIKNYRSQSFYAFGSVNKPGQNQLTGEAFLLDALTMAGGLSERAGRIIQIHHNAPVTPGSEIAVPSPEKDAVEIDLDELLEKGDMRLNVRIQPGDVISVPERHEEFFYVLGDVPKPGAYLIRKDERVTLSKAIATAGGFLPTASGKKTTIMRPNQDGVSATQIQVDAVAVIKGQGQDREIAGNDIVLVPGSTSKTLSRNFMSGITSLVTSFLFFGIR